MLRFPFTATNLVKNPKMKTKIYDFKRETEKKKLSQWYGRTIYICKKYTRFK